uniref:ribosomal protein L14 n=1 Tax=Prototheca moriformis TaxID=183676 RepID=UPI003001893F
MIQTQTFLKIADNTGAKKIMCIRVLNGKSAKIGDTIVGVIKEALPNAAVKRSEIVRAVVVRTQSKLKRKDGTHIHFNENAAIILNKKMNPRGTRIFGPILYELRNKGFQKILSLASMII